MKRQKKLYDKALKSDSKDNSLGGETSSYNGQVPGALSRKQNLISPVDRSQNITVKSPMDNVMLKAWTTTQTSDAESAVNSDLELDPVLQDSSFFKKKFSKQTSKTRYSQKRLKTRN